MTPQKPRPVRVLTPPPPPIPPATSGNGGASWSATTAFILGVTGTIMLLVGVFAAALGALDADASAYLEVGVGVGLISALCFPLAVLLGLVGIYETTRDPSRSGRDKAIKGLVLGVVGVLLWGLAVAALAGAAS